MSKGTCGHDGCDRQHYAHGLCTKHYSQWRRETGAPCEKDECTRTAVSRGLCGYHRRHALEAEAPPCSTEGCERPAVKKGQCNSHYRMAIRATWGPCSVEGCETTMHAAGLCGTHYHRKRKYGTTDAPVKPERDDWTCTVDGCDGPIKARDLCGMHLRRWYKWGSTELPTRERKSTRKCRMCERDLARVEFPGTGNVCIQCMPLYRQERLATRLSRAAGVQRSAAVLREAQGGMCAICGIDESDAPGGRLHVDHDHASGVIRALLCGNCNAGIGQLKDDPHLCEIAAAYLRAHQEDGMSA